MQKSGEAVRINVQLIKAQEDSHLWAETYDRRLLDVFAVETEVAQRIAGSLEARLTGREKQELARVPTQNAEPYRHISARSRLGHVAVGPRDRAIARIFPAGR